jgi:hypothetical protein
MKAIKRLKKEEDVVLDLLQRLAFLQAFEKELETTTREKPFVIRNDDLWAAMLAARDALFIHFASWARSAYQPSGLFAQLKAHHLAELYVKRPRDRDASGGIGEALAGERRSAMEACFANAANRGKVLGEDVDALKDRFEAITRPVVDDRDAFRAHPYEKGQAGTAAMLHLSSVRPIFEQVQRLLNEVRLVVDDSTLGYHGDLAATGPESSARDLTDLLLFGSSVRYHRALRCVEESPGQGIEYPALVRGRLYERLHDAHDLDEGDRMFNHRQLVERVCLHSGRSVDTASPEKPKRCRWPLGLRRLFGGGSESDPPPA